MNLPPKGSLARDSAELGVHLRRLGRTLVHVPGLGPAPLGLLAGGVYRTWVFFGICNLIGLGIALAYLWLTGRLG